MRKSVLLTLLALAGCTKEVLPVSIPYMDDFSRTDIGPNWSGPLGKWRIENGELAVAVAHNECLWLRAALPEEGVIEFDCRSESPEGDLKFIAYGDGKHHESGYSFIFGGWKNTLSIISRLGEHTPDRLEKADKLELGRTYHFKMIRRGKHCRWYIDGKAYLDFFDSEPLSAKGHDRFSFCNWESRAYFDNLKIRRAVGIEPEEKAGL